MKKLLFLPTVRPHLFKIYLDSLVHLPDWDLAVAFQCYTKENMKEVESHPNASRITHSMSLPIRSPLYPLRCKMLERFGSGYDFFCNTDDDIIFQSTVNYDPILDHLTQPGTGVISGAWVKAISMLPSYSIKPSFVKQSLIYTAGGMLFGRNVVDILLSSPIRPFLFDDVQISMMAYVNGLSNYRYLGSLIVHGVQQKGGLNVLYKTLPLEPNPPALIRLRPTKLKLSEFDNDYHIPIPADLTPFAHQLHKKFASTADK